MPAAASRGPSANSSGLPVEERLVDYIDQLDRHRKGGRAIRLHLSLLATENRRERHIQAAVNTLHGLTSVFDGAVFAISNTDLFLVCSGANVLKIDEAVQKVRYLFSEDPLFQIDPNDGEERFCTWFDLAEDYDAFRKAASNCVTANELRQAAKKKSPHAGANSPPPDGFAVNSDASGMSLSDYARIEVLLGAADLSNMIHQQPICALTRDDPPHRIFDEIYVSIAELQESLAPNQDLTGDRWMFQRLTRTLDRRVLKALNNAYDTVSCKAMSLNMNVATILSPEFKEFDTSLRVGARGTIMIEFNVVDIFGDIGAYAYARDLLQDNDYRVCIDGLTHLTATFIERAKLGADLIKIYWSRDIDDDPAGNQMAALADNVRNAGPTRVILCRCDDVKAIRIGLDLGVSMYQGRLIDTMLLDGKSLSEAA